LPQGKRITDIKEHSQLNNYGVVLEVMAGYGHLSKVSDDKTAASSYFGKTFLNATSINFSFLLKRH
jgi:hypothetical protein